jgi:nucleotide-binding universal stress UspA family protein
MTDAAARPVLVGMDYSADSRTAGQYAAWEAMRRGVPLRLVHSIDPPPAYGAVVPMNAMVNDATRLLSNFADELRAQHPEVAVEHSIVTGGAAATIVSQSTEASLVVVGRRGAGGFPELLTGSVSAQAAAHAHAPVVVVRHDGAPPPAGPVVVGVDGSEQSQAVLAFAFDQARARHCALVAVYAWDIPSYQYLGPVGHRDHDLAQARDRAEGALAETLAGWSDKYPEVELSRHAIHSASPAAALRDAAAEAGLLVVGSRGHGGFVGLLLGSVSRALVGHARCNLAVVHNR